MALHSLSMDGPAPTGALGPAARAWLRGAAQWQCPAQWHVARGAAHWHVAAAARRGHHGIVTVLLRQHLPRGGSHVPAWHGTCPRPRHSQGCVRAHNVICLHRAHAQRTAHALYRDTLIIITLFLLSLDNRQAKAARRAPASPCSPPPKTPPPATAIPSVRH